MEIGNEIKKILGIFTPEQPKSTKKKQNEETQIEELTITRLVNDIVVFFDEQMQNKSAQIGNNCRIMYPMSFNILLHPDDYQRIGEDIKFQIPLILTGFYGAIKNKIQKLTNEKKCFTYTPPATYWFFQWAACVQHTDSKNQSTPVLKGEAHIISSLTTFDVTNNEDVSNISNVKQTGRVINSNTEGKNINMMALLKSDLSLPNADKYNFDENLPTDINVIMGEQRNNTNAIASLTISGKRFFMLDDLITVSGSSETRTPSGNLFVIDNPDIIKSHLQIKYDRETKQFKVCAYAPIVVNEKPVTLSVGGQPVWEPLSMKSKIFFTDALLTMEFVATITAKP